MLTNEGTDDAERESRRRATELFVELASGSTTFSTVVSTRYAEWRNLFRVLKELRDDETSALRGCAADGSAPTDFESWGRERSPMFADEFGKFLRHEGCVRAVELTWGARLWRRARRRRRGKARPGRRWGVMRRMGRRQMLVWSRLKSRFVG